MSILDRTVPVRTVRYRRRFSDPWYDEEFCMEKCQVRFLERECRKADPSRVAAATSAWMARRRSYRDLLRLKRIVLDCEGRQRQVQAISAVAVN